MSALNKLKTRDRLIALACKKLMPQFPIDEPCGRVMYLAMAQVIKDAFGSDRVSAENRSSALRYLMQPNMYCAEVAGVESDWVRAVLARYELPVPRDGVELVQILSRYDKRKTPPVGGMGVMA